MINKVIEEWIGEDVILQILHSEYPNVETWKYDSYARTIEDKLKSRIPELSEQLTTEIYSSLLSRFDNDVWDIEGTREVDGKDFISPEQLKRIREILFTELTSKE